MGVVVAIGAVNILPLLNGGIFPCCDLVCADTVKEVCADDSVIVAGEGAQLPAHIEALAIVVDADSELDTLSLFGNAVITCGIGSRNTVSVTSKTTDMITLSLNRAIHTQQGLCEPMELPVPRLDGCSDFDHMAAFAVAVLLGDI